MKSLTLKQITRDHAKLPEFVFRDHVTSFDNLYVQGAFSNIIYQVNKPERAKIGVTYNIHRDLVRGFSDDEYMVPWDEKPFILPQMFLRVPDRKNRCNNSLLQDMEVALFEEYKTLERMTMDTYKVPESINGFFHLAKTFFRAEDTIPEQESYTLSPKKAEDIMWPVTHFIKETNTRYATLWKLPGTNTFSMTSEENPLQKSLHSKESIVAYCAIPMNEEIPTETVRDCTLQVVAPAFFMVGMDGAKL